MRAKFEIALARLREGLGKFEELGPRRGLERLGDRAQR